MYQALIVVHVLIALSIIGMVLLQQGRGADAGAGFGGGASNTLFGARGSASFLSRTTAILAVLFFSSSLLLAHLGDKQDNTSRDIMDAPVSEQVRPDLPPVTKESPVPAVTDLPDKVDLPKQADDKK